MLLKFKFSQLQRAWEIDLFCHYKYPMCIVGSLLIFKAINNFFYSSRLNILILQHFSFLVLNMLLPMQYRWITVLFLFPLISRSVKNKTLLPSCSTHISRTNAPLQLAHTYSDTLYTCILKFLSQQIIHTFNLQFLFLSKRCN